MSHIILAGFMATGKTEVGRRVAQALGRTFVDTDALVESAAGRSVAEIFAAEGEAAFRAREREAIGAACDLPDAVIAVGGGALADPENRRRLAAAGPIVCLTAEPEEVLRRVGSGSSRPLIAAAGASREARLARIRALLEERAPVYAIATHTIDTTRLGVDEVARRVQAVTAAR